MLYGDTKRTKPTGLVLLAMVLIIVLGACSSPSGSDQGGNNGNGNGNGGLTAGTQSVRTVSGVNFALRYVPDGSFRRGIAASGEISVITKAYWIGETEVTQELWLAVMGNNPSNFNGSSGKEAAAGETQNKRPVENMNWYAAIAFCNKLSLLDGKTPVYSVTVSGAEVDWTALSYSGIPTSVNADWSAVSADWNADGYRLPTEMEWMWAALGADKTQQPNTTGYMRAYSGSTEVMAGMTYAGDYVWYDVNAGGKTHETGLKLPNQLGVYDMTGNVEEWCWDWYDDFPASVEPLTDYKGPATGTYEKVVRGHYYNASVLTIRSRIYHESLVYPYSGRIGFRIACN